MSSYKLEDIRSLDIVDFFKYGAQLDSTGFLLPFANMNKQEKKEKETAEEVIFGMKVADALKQGKVIRF